MKAQQLWVFEVRNAIYFTREKPNSLNENNVFSDCKIVSIIQNFTDVAELRELFSLERGVAKYISMNEVQEPSTVNG